MLNKWLWSTQTLSGLFLAQIYIYLLNGGRMDHIVCVKQQFVCKTTIISKEHAGGRRGVVVTRLIQSAKLLYAGPG